MRSSVFAVALSCLVACGGDDAAPDPEGEDGGWNPDPTSGTGGGGSGGDPDPEGGTGGSGDDASMMMVDAGEEMVLGPLGLDITDVISSTQQDCVEPTEGAPLDFAAAGTLHFEAKVGSDTTPPTDWVPGSTCTAGDTGLVCDVGDTDLLVYQGSGAFVAISFDAVDSVGSNVSLTGESSASVTTESSRTMYIAAVSNGDKLYRSSAGTVMTLSNLRVTPLPATTAVEANKRVLFTLAEPTAVDGVTNTRGLRHLAGFQVSTDGDYHVGYACTTTNDGGNSCASNPSCQLYDASGMSMGSLDFEWDASVDPNDSDFYFSDPDDLRRVTASRMLTAGTYYLGCGNPGRVFVRSYPDALVRSCNYLTWYFSLRQGDEPVTGLEVSSIKPTVDGRDLGVEAGAALTQNNTARVALLLDGSYSLTVADAAAAVKDAAKAFVSAMPQGTLYQVHQFASEQAVPQGVLGVPHSDTEAVQTSLDDYAPWATSTSAGFTKLFDAIGRTTVLGYSAYQGAFPPSNFSYLQRVMVVFTDGEDTASTVFVDGTGKPSASHVKYQLQLCRVNALSVGLGTEIMVDTLRSLTGNNIFVAADNASLTETFQAVADDLNSRYRLKMLTPQPVMISDSSSLRIDLGGRTVTSIYKPPSESCRLHDSPFSIGSIGQDEPAQ